MQNQLFISLIFLSGGKGLRMGSTKPKQYLPLKNKPLALHSFEKFQEIPEIQEIIVAADPDYQSIFQSSLPISFSHPGKERMLSAYNALKKVSKKSDYLIIHDAARPFISKKQIEKLIEKTKGHPAGCFGTPLSSTIKRCKNENVIETLNRSGLYQIQTPQMVQTYLFSKALENLISKNRFITDDVSAIEYLKLPVLLLEGHPSNIKITTPIDYELAKVLYAAI